MTPYERELAKLTQTLANASNVDIAKLKAAIAGASESGIIAVGSGGSYTVASLLCRLHETFTGRLSRPVTPLELICNPTLAATSPIFIFSAEGKNPDVIEALQRARTHSSRAVHVITNRETSPLMERAGSLNDVTAHVFNLVEKDGYLATNSLVLDAALLARAYGELNVPGTILDLTDFETAFQASSLDEWLHQVKDFAEKLSSTRGLIVIYSPLLRPIAEDLESKLSEAALLYTQLADFRSFAHGRHLWLTQRAESAALLVITEPDVSGLWGDMSSQVPQDVPVCELALRGARPGDLIAGLIAAMHLVSLVANRLERNVGKPEVSDFGRRLYYADLEKLIPPPTDLGKRGEPSKFDVLGAHWPNLRRNGKLRRALEETEREFKEKKFKAIVFDYDGTLCSSNSLDLPPTDTVIREITRLTSAGIIVGIASGRGGSIGEMLETKLDKALWPMVRLGLYNGGWLGVLGEHPQKDGNSTEFLIHAKRIVSALKSYGVPINTVRETAPYQLSVRFESGVSSENMWFVIVDAMKQDGLETGTILRSKHSIDILSRGVSKSHLVAKIVKTDKLDPYEILTMGDLGAWPGNDSSLLQHRYSLSVDLPSRRLDRGWKLAPQYKRDVDATLWYLSRAMTQGGELSFNFE